MAAKATRKKLRLKKDILKKLVVRTGIRRASTPDPPQTATVARTTTCPAFAAATALGPDVPIRVAVRVEQQPQLRLHWASHGCRHSGAGSPLVQAASLTAPRRPQRRAKRGTGAPEPL
jgi:hypothetical protein